jgi:hypothetical protein
VGLITAVALTAVVLGRPRLTAQPQFQWAATQTPLTWSRNVPGDSKPINLYADNITTWTDQGNRIFLLKGKVWIEQGIVDIQMAQGMAVLDELQRKRTGIYHLDVYTDTEISLKDGPSSSSGRKGHIELNTRGEIRLKAYRDKVVQAPATADAVYVRAVAVQQNLVTAVAKPLPTASIQPTAALVPTAQKAAQETALKPALPYVPAYVQPSGYPLPALTAPASSATIGQPATALPPAREARAAVPQVKLSLPD